MTREVISDQSARDAIAGVLAKTFVVQAGAGTGKTHSLVERIARLLSTGEARIDQLVAITFTRAAAAELREQVRIHLEQLDSEFDHGSAPARHVSTALDGLDYAAIQTIHSFAQSIVQEGAVWAGLPLVIEPMDDVAEKIELDDRWTACMNDALTNGGDLAEAILELHRLGLSDVPSQARSIVDEFTANYDLLPDTPIPVANETLRGTGAFVAGSSHELDDLLQYSRLGDEDKLYAHTVEIIQLGRKLDGLDPKGQESLSLLVGAGKISIGSGRQSDWDNAPDGVNACKRLKAILRDLDNYVQADLATAREAATTRLIELLRVFVLDYAAERRRSGRASFQDLLVWACDLLRRPQTPSPRYSHLLIDEFQDTDPLQIELALLLTKGLPDGALFAVGDPKQSIYGFRRADPKAGDRLIFAAAAQVLDLTQTRRTHEGITTWANHVFGEWMRSGGETQATYTDLTTARAADVSGFPQGVYWYGEDYPDLNAHQVRLIEAERVAQVARSVANGQWTIIDRDTGETRPSTLKDMAVLFRSRTISSYLQRSLTDAKVPFVVEGASNVFATQEIRDLISALAAIDDPSDQIALVAALRSAAFACSDADLFEWRQAGGGFNYLADIPKNSAESVVSKAMNVLKAFHHARNRLTPVELIQNLVEERQLRFLALDGPQTRERHRLLEVILETARDFAARGNSSLRAFTRWAGERLESGDGVTDTAAESDQDAIRLMTVHAAKGLEFPIVVMADLTRSLGGSAGKVLFDRKYYVDDSGADPGPIAVRLGGATSGFACGPYDDRSEYEKSAGELESVRLMYVAATRARDYLIVSLHRPGTANNCAASRIATIMDGRDVLWNSMPDLDLTTPVESGPKPTLVNDLSAADDWDRTRAELLTLRSAPRSISATRLRQDAATHEPRLFEDTKPMSSDQEQRPWSTGRSATAIGRAVHAVLQHADLVTGADIPELADKHAVAEGVRDYTDEVSRLAAATIETAVMRRAANSGNVIREAYIAATVSSGAPIIEGYIDLMFVDDDGKLVVIDYKTDRIADDGSLEDHAAEYAVQLGAYAHALDAAGHAVSEAWLVFSRRAIDGLPAEYRVPDLPAAMEMARQTTRRAVEVQRGYPPSHP